MQNDGKWHAQLFRYPQSGNPAGVALNPGRWEIFAPGPDGHLISVGGAFETHCNGAIAFLCMKADQSFIRKPKDAETRFPDLFVWGVSLRQALSRLKYRHPFPLESLNQAIAMQKLLF